MFNYRTIEGGELDAQQTIGQIHFCNLVTSLTADAFSSTNQLLQDELIGLIPALSLLHASTTPYRWDASELQENYSSLTSILNVSLE